MCHRLLSLGRYQSLTIFSCYPFRVYACKVILDSTFSTAMDPQKRKSGDNSWYTTNGFYGVKCLLFCFISCVPLPSVCQPPKCLRPLDIHLCIPKRVPWLFLDHSDNFITTTPENTISLVYCEPSDKLQRTNTYLYIRNTIKRQLK